MNLSGQYALPRAAFATQQHCGFGWCHLPGHGQHLLHRRFVAGQVVVRRACLHFGAEVGHFLAQAIDLAPAHQQQPELFRREGFRQESKAPARMASTAVSMAAWAVITT